MMSGLKALLSRLLRDRSGLSAIEFAMMMPIFLVLLTGMVDFGRLILISQKLQSGTFILADLAARDETLSEAQIIDIFLALGNVVEPFDLSTRGRGYVTSVTGGPVGSDPQISWQRAGAGTLAATSQIGVEGGVAAIPPDLPLADGENLIVTEVYYDYDPIFGMSFGADVLRRVAYYRPRLGALTTVSP